MCLGMQKGLARIFISFFRILLVFTYNDALNPCESFPIKIVQVKTNQIDCVHVE